MIIKEIEYKLKDGRNALIRSPKNEDVQGMQDCLSISAGETKCYSVKRWYSIK